MSKEPEKYEPRGRIDILPPGDEEEDASRIFIATGSHRVKIVKLGPFGTLMMMAAVALLMLLGFMFFTSALLIILPVAALLAAGAYVSGLIGNPFKRLR